MDMNLILALLVATNVIMALQIYKVKRGLRYSDIMMMAVMEEGAPKLYADYEDWDKKRRERHESP